MYVCDPSILEVEARRLLDQGKISLGYKVISSPG